MAELKYVKGDVTKIKQKGYIIIPHVCNDLGVMGAGVALALKKKWDNVFPVYIGSVNYHKKHGFPILGKCPIAEAYSGNNAEIRVANMIAQHGVKSEGNPKPLKYAALIKCMEEVRVEATYYDHIFNNGKSKIATIHAPKFGSDLSGGNFEFVLELINEIWVEHGIDVVVYSFSK